MKTLESLTREELCEIIAEQAMENIMLKRKLSAEETYSEALSAQMEGAKR